jgi:hypothetical protein
MDGTAAYHNNVDTAERLDKAGLQDMGSNMLGLTRGFGDRDLASTHSQDDAVFFSVFLQLIMYPMWLVWPLAGLAIAIMVVWVCSRASGERRPYSGCWRGRSSLIADHGGTAGCDRPVAAADHGAAGLRDPVYGRPYRPQLYSWALAGLTVTILLARYLTLRRLIGATSLAIGALVWPAILGLVTAWLLPAMSLRIARSDRSRRPARTAAPPAMDRMECGCACSGNSA